jgi:hypothetical protein
MIQDASRGERRALDEHLRAFAGNPHALQAFMDGLAKIFTYDDNLRPSLATVWVPSLTTVLNALDDGADIFAGRGSWSDFAIASLLPTPELDVVDLDPDATLARCRSSWIDPDHLAPLIDRWLTIAKGEPRAAEAVAALARTAPVVWQISTGLAWLEAVINDRAADFSNQVPSVTNWLRDLHGMGVISGPVVAPFHRIIDSLAAGGDTAAVAIQLLEE